MAIVYIVINIKNGKRYIGYTKNSLKQRRWGHYGKLGNKNIVNKFLNALRKYPKDTFRWEILESFDDLRDAIVAEAEYIKKLNPEYNITAGGEHPTGPYNRTNKRKTVCLNDGQIFDSVSDAARYYAINSSSISQVCCRSEKRKSVKNLVFRFFGDHCGGTKEAEDQLKIAKESQLKYLSTGHLYNQRKIMCCISGEIYENIAAASRILNVPKSSISSSCNRRSKLSYNRIYDFKYLD